jgi:hypothetical protein
MEERLIGLPEVIFDSLAQAGDIVRVDNGWSAGKKLFPSGMIRRLDRVKHEGKWYKSAINHVYRKFTFSNGMQFICESHFKGGVQINSYTKLLKAIQVGKVIRVYEKEVELSSEAMAELWNNYLVFEGSGYDKKLILLYYIWNRTGRGFDKLLSRSGKHKYTCNEIFYTTGRGIDPLCKDSTIKDTPEHLIYKVIGKPSSFLKVVEFDYNNKVNNKMWVDYEPKN